MRFLTLLLLSSVAIARPTIEVVPVYVSDEAPSQISLAKVLGQVYSAMEILGVQPHEYSVELSPKKEYLECEKETLWATMQCTGLAAPTDVMHRAEALSPGEYSLYILLTPPNWPRPKVMGAARLPADVKRDHWTTRSCRAASFYSLPVIAHELGHCFGLVHNSETVYGELDLMRLDPQYMDWLHTHNKAIVRHTFRELAPTSIGPVRQEMSVW